MSITPGNINHEWMRKYERKFASLLRMCAETKRKKQEIVLIHHPEVLGDDYAELVESLNRISDSGLQLAIVPRTERAKASK